MSSKDKNLTEHQVYWQTTNNSSTSQLDGILNVQYILHGFIPES